MKTHGFWLRSVYSKRTFHGRELCCWFAMSKGLVSLPSLTNQEGWQMRRADVAPDSVDGYVTYADDAYIEYRLHILTRNLNFKHGTFFYTCFCCQVGPVAIWDPDLNHISGKSLVEQLLGSPKVTRWLQVKDEVTQFKRTGLLSGRVTAKKSRPPG